MKFSGYRIGYIIAILGWLAAAVIFRYGLYPPQLMFWLVLCAGAFVASGLTRDKWAGVKVITLIWALIPLIHSIYPGSTIGFKPLLLAFFLSFIVSYFLGLFATGFKLKHILMGLMALTLISSLVLGTLYYQVEKEGKPVPVTKADTAIILGAAVWEGGIPSPSMYARVKEGVKLYEKGLVDKLIVTGGVGRIPPSEGEVMGKLARELGVPSEDILLEDKAKTTEENIMYSKAIGEKAGFNTYIIVTDAFHLKRALWIAHNLGLSAQGAPALESPLYTNDWLRFKYTLRETFALIKYLIR